MEDVEKQFITSYNTILTQEAKKLCEDILVMIGEKEEMLKRKAEVFALCFLNHKLDGVETIELEKRCKNYLNNLYDFHCYERTFRSVKNDRKLKN